MKIFLTSDTFFGRSTLAVESGFSNVEEMNNLIIDNWNSKVSSDDFVYHLGNFAWDPLSSEYATSLLNGRIFFIGGSYDKILSENSLVKAQRHFLLPTITELPELNSVLSHWPMERWQGKDDGVMHFHGGEKIENSQIKNRWCVNSKNWNRSPVEFELMKDIQKLEESESKII